MEKLLSYCPQILFSIGIWYLVNGILHDIFVLLSEHGKHYDRNLLRLLMDGHVLIVGGAVLMICYNGFKTDTTFAYYVALAICLSMLGYCAMIWPFLKSVATTLISLGGIVLCILKLVHLKS